MNKELKIFFITSLSIIVIGGLFIVYHFQFKEFEVADKEVDQVIESPSDTVSPNGSEIVLEGEDPKGDKKSGQSSDSQTENAEGQRGTSGSSSTGGSEGTTTSGSDAIGNGMGSRPSSTNQTNDGKQPSTENKTTSTGQSATGNTDQKQSVAQIKSNYQPSVNKLQEEVDGELNTLVSRAKKEYSAKKANGENIDYGYFYNKYMSSIAGLEAQTDAEFNGIMSSLEKDLQANGHKKSNAQSVRDEYEAQKNARRDSMQSEIMGR